MNTIGRTTGFQIPERWHAEPAPVLVHRVAGAQVELLATALGVVWDDASRRRIAGWALAEVLRLQGGGAVSTAILAFGDSGRGPAATLIGVGDAGAPTPILAIRRLDALPVLRWQDLEQHGGFGLTAPAAGVGLRQRLSPVIAAWREGRDPRPPGGALTVLGGAA
jgi:hypothetical protein